MRQYFNPRSPHGERPSFPISDTATLKFQSTLPAWERRGWQLAAVRNGVFQSTLPHGGATRKPFEIETERIYFNPRPPHGERPGFLECSRFSSKFQSTLPHGERPPTIPLNRRDDAISIHAPAWGATTLSSSRRMVSSYFNPRPRMGSDTSVSFLSVDRDLFQSTLPHGERLTGKGVGSITISISIHAPAWRATLHHGHGLHGNQISIHAPAWGATAAYGLASSTSAFQSTLPHGERQMRSIFQTRT